MYISYLRLLNFRGIYSGMSKEEITLTFPKPKKSKSRIVLLMGGNGSGKSTVLSSLQPFASSFDGRDESLIRTDKNGEKEIHFIKGEDKYEIFHQYIRVGTTGRVLASTTTKSFISKNGKELNENGGVKTFKDIVKQELGIEDSFFKIGRVASTTANFTDLPTGERKEFIIKQLPDTSEWLEAYENAKDKCNITNKQITSISLDLNKFEKEEVLKERYRVSERNLNDCVKTISELEKSKAVYDSHIQDFEKDDNNKKNIEKIKRLEKLYVSLDGLEKSIIKSRKDLKLIDPEKFDEYGSQELSTKINKIEIKLATKESRSEFINESVIQLTNQRNNIIDNKRKAEKQKEEMISFDLTEEQLLHQRDKIKEKIKEINTIYLPIKKLLKKEKNLSEILLLSQKERNSIINRINLVMEKLNGFYSDVNNDLKVPTVSKYETVEEDIKDLIQIYSKMIESDSIKLEELNAILSQLEKELEISLRLNKKVPKGCKITTCPFRNGLLDDEGKKVNTRKIDTLRNITIPDLQEKIKKNQQALDSNMRTLELCKSLEEVRIMLNQKSLILYTSEFFNVTSYGSFFNSLKKIKIIDVFTSVKKKCDNIEDYIYGKNELQVLNEKIEDIDNKISYLKNNARALKQLQDSIDNSSKQIDILQKDIDVKNEESLVIKQNILQINKQMNIVRNYFEQVKMYEDSVDEIEKLEKDVKKFEALNSKYNKWKLQSEELRKRLDEYTGSRDEIRIHTEQIYASIARFKELKEKCESLKDNYLKQILVRDVADPKKGFPLIYLRNFMNDIEALSNKLFEIAFGKDKFYISFQIDEKVFRINIYKADGDVLDDVKLASDGERSLIKLIISLSFLSQFTSIYPIMTLDEVDAVLDDTYRSNFATIIDGQIRQLGLSQVFIISHNENFRNEEIPVCLFPRNTFNIGTEGNTVLFDYSK